MAKSKKTAQKAENDLKIEVKEPVLKKGGKKGIDDQPIVINPNYSSISRFGDVTFKLDMRSQDDSTVTLIDNASGESVVMPVGGGASEPDEDLPWFIEGKEVASAAIDPDSSDTALITFTDGTTGSLIAYADPETGDYVTQLLTDGGSISMPKITFTATTTSMKSYMSYAVYNWITYILGE